MAVSLSPHRLHSLSSLHHRPSLCFLSPRVTIPTATRSLSPPPLRIQVHSATGNASSTPSAPTGDPKAGVSVYKPKSYEVLVTDAAKSLALALQDGKTRLEIDFPPLPSSISSYKGSSDEFIDANIQLALTVARKLQEKTQFRTCIVFPDKPERRRATQIFKTALDLIDGLTIGSLDDVPGSAVSGFFRSIRDTLDFDFEDENEGRWQSDDPPSLYLFLNCSTRDLSLREVMLKQADGSYVCVAESASRFTLGETKEELLRVLGLQEEQGSSLEFLRRGYKTTTWWEEETDLEASSEWRS